MGKSFQNGIDKAEAFINSKMADCGMKVENASAGAIPKDIYKSSNTGLVVYKSYGICYVDFEGKSYSFPSKEDAVRAANTKNFMYGIRVQNAFVNGRDLAIQGIGIWKKGQLQIGQFYDIYTPPSGDKEYGKVTQTTSTDYTVNVGSRKVTQKWNPY